MTPLPTTYTTYIQRLVRLLKDYFNLQDYELTTKYQREDDSTGYGQLLATIRTDPRYFNILLDLYPPVFKYYSEHDYEKVGRILVHEFCHTLYQPIYNRFSKNVSEAEEDEVENLFEQQVQRTANIVFQSLPQSFYLPTPTPKSTTKKKVSNVKSTRNRK